MLASGEHEIERAYWQLISLGPLVESLPIALVRGGWMEGEGRVWQAIVDYPDPVLGAYPVPLENGDEGPVPIDVRL